MNTAYPQPTLLAPYMNSTRWHYDPTRTAATRWMAPLTATIWVAVTASSTLPDLVAALRSLLVIAESNEKTRELSMSNNENNLSTLIKPVFLNSLERTLPAAPITAERMEGTAKLNPASGPTGAEKTDRVIIVDPVLFLPATTSAADTVTISQLILSTVTVYATASLVQTYTILPAVTKWISCVEGVNYPAGAAPRPISNVTILQNAALALKKQDSNSTLRLGPELKERGGGSVKGGAGAVAHLGHASKGRDADMHITVVVFVLLGLVLLVL